MFHMIPLRNSPFVIRRVSIWIIVALALSLLFPMITQANGSNFVDGEWRADITSVNQSDNYALYVAHQGFITNRNDSFTTGWLGVYLYPYTGQTFSASFSQIGIQSRNGQLYWFVYSELGVTCLRGYYTPADADGIHRGCNGFDNDLVGLNQTNIFQIAKFGGTWYLEVYNTSVGGSAYVATINSPTSYTQPVYCPSGSPQPCPASSAISEASGEAEEGYDGSFDPLLPMAEYFYHPSYSPTGAYITDWPGGNNMIHTPGLINGQSQPEYQVCTRYGAVLNLNGDPRFYYGGTGGTLCYASPFF